MSVETCLQGERESEAPNLYFQEVIHSDSLCCVPSLWLVSSWLVPSFCLSFFGMALIQFFDLCVDQLTQLSTSLIRNYNKGFALKSLYALTACSSLTYSDQYRL